MANTPKTIRVTNDHLADEIMRAGQKLIDLSMQIREGFEVPVEYHLPVDEKGNGQEGKTDA